MKSLGTKLLIGDTSPVQVAELTAIGGLEVSADTMDVSNLDGDGWREFEQGWKDAGEVSIEGRLNLETGKGQKELFDLLNSGEKEKFQIQFPPKLNASWEFDGIVTAFSTSADLEDPLSFSASIKVSGKPVLTIGTQG